MYRLSFRLAWAVATTAMVTGSGCTPQSMKIDGQFTLQPGDLLFQDLDAGPLCDAIEKVTQGCSGADFTHVGVVWRTPPSTPVGSKVDSPPACEVLEAVSAGVVVTPLATFLARSKDARGRPKVVVGRLKAEHRSILPITLVPEALDHGLSLVGRPYDRVFEIDNDAFYCSELVYEMFAHGNGGKPLFHLEPMTFKDPDTGATFGVWADYFGELGLSVPEGQPGINPGGISRSPKIEIVHMYGIPTGWKQTDRGWP